MQLPKNNYAAFAFLSMQAVIVLWFTAIGGLTALDDFWNNGWMLLGGFAMGCTIAWVAGQMLMLILKIAARLR